MIVTILRTSGAVEEIDVQSKELLRQVERLIAADCLDTVNLRDGRVMLVDDNGYESKAVDTEYGCELVPVKARKPVNVEATKLYHAICVPGTTHQIVGDVAILRDDEIE